jgi:hypothetical protein
MRISLFPQKLPQPAITQRLHGATLEGRWHSTEWWLSRPWHLAHQQNGRPPAECAAAECGLRAFTGIADCAGIVVSFPIATGPVSEMLSRLATCRLQCRCSAAVPTPISLAPLRMLNPCRNSFSASSLRGCLHTLQGRLTSVLLWCFLRIYSRAACAAGFFQNWKISPKFAP